MGLAFKYGLLFLAALTLPLILFKMFILPMALLTGLKMISLVNSLLLGSLLLKYKHGQHGHHHGHGSGGYNANGQGGVNGGGINGGSTINGGGGINGGGNNNSGGINGGGGGNNGGGSAVTTPSTVNNRIEITYGIK